MQIQNISYPAYNNYYFNKSKVAKTPNFTGFVSPFGRTLHKALDRGYPTEVEKKNLFEELQEFIAKHLNSDTMLGVGAHGAVHKVDDDFCIKVDLQEAPKLTNIENFSKDKFANLKTYYGQSVAKFGDVEVMKNVSSDKEHVPVGVPLKFAYENADINIDAYYEQVCLPRLVDLPQRSFDAVAGDCQRLNKMSSATSNYTFDYVNPNNFIIVGDDIRIIDDINKSNIAYKNNVSNLLSVFLEKSYLDHPTEYSMYSETARRSLFKKIVLAGMKEDLPMRNRISTEDLDTWKNVVNELCGIDDSYSTVLQNLERIQHNIPDKTLRVRAAKEYIESLFEYDSFYS